MNKLVAMAVMLFTDLFLTMFSTHRQLWSIFKAFVESGTQMKLKLNELLFNGHFQSQNLCVYNLAIASQG